MLCVQCKTKPALFIEAGSNVPFCGKQCQEYQFIAGSGKKRPRTEDAVVVLTLINALKATSVGNSPAINELLSPLIADLFESAKDENIEEIQTLIQAGMDINILNDEGVTVLIESTRTNKQRVVEFLLSQDNIDPNIQGPNGYTALHWAAVLSLTTSASHFVKSIHEYDNNLLAHGAGKIYISSEQILELLLKHSKINVNIQTSNHLNTPLMLAIRNLRFLPDNHISQTMDLLLNHPNINVNLQDYTGGTALHIAIIDYTETYKPKVIKNLVKHPALNVNIQDNKGATALHYIITIDDLTECFETLLARQETNVNLQDNKGRTPLHKLTIYIRNSIFDGIEIDGLNVELKNLIILLKDRRTNPNIQTNEGRTALHFAADNNITELTAILLADKHVNPNIQDNLGNTPLHDAMGNIEIVEMLLMHPKTFPLIVNNNGQTPLDLAPNVQIRLLFKAYLIAKKGILKLPLDVGKMIAARNIQLEICDYLGNENNKANLVELARILQIPDELIQGKSKDDLCIVVSDVVAYGAIWNLQLYDQAKNARQKAAEKSSRVLLTLPFDVAVAEVKEYFGIRSLDQMTNAQLWAIMGKFRTQ